VEELQGVVASCERVRALGSRHSFNDIGDTDGDLISLEDLPRRFELDPVAATLTVDGGARYGDVCAGLDAAGFAIQNLPSLPHISVAGACLTGTHGSGDKKGVLATRIAALEMVAPTGELLTIDQGSQDVPVAAASVSLGMLGVVTSLTLMVEPRYQMRQDVYERMPLPNLLRGFDAITRLGDSVSCFLDWRNPVIDQVWVKRRIPTDDDHEVPMELGDATRATADLHPIRSLDPAACSPQLGRIGPWHERLPHFRLGHTPSSGEELQSEYFVPRHDAPGAIEALWAIRESFAHLVQVSEIRTVTSDDLWLSPASGRATAAIHFTWVRDADRVRAVLPGIEAALAPMGRRAHWAKVSALSGPDLLSTYPRAGDFAALRSRLDPDRKFANRWTEQAFGAV
jgi:alditol oxidase